MENKQKQIFDEMYAKAKPRGLEYGYFLVRVADTQYFDGDPIMLLKQKLDEGSAKDTDIDACKDFWVLLINLERLADNSPYRPFPLNTSLGSPEITDYYQAALPHLSDNLRSSLEEMRRGGRYIELAKYILEKYGAALSEFFQVNPYYMRDPQFTVTEFFARGDSVGFIAHHSNGTSSTFERSPTETQGVNLALGDIVDYFVGELSELRKEWLINGEPMYKANLIGKYNADGEWKPIVYSGDSDIAKDAAESASEDWDVQGIFFYMYTTGFPVIEFVLKTKMELPDNPTELNGVHFLRVETGNEMLMNEYIYDGWVRFEDLTEAGIKEALDLIRLTIEGLTFTFGVSAKWELKYKLRHNHRGVSIPSTADIKAANQLLTSIDKSPDKDILMAAVSWFNLGAKTDNPILAFVCCYTAIESLARKLAEGKLEASAFFKTKVTKLTDEEILKEYDELYKAHYPADIKILLRKGYFDIHETLNRSVKSAFDSVYGEKHGAYKAMFNGKTGLVGLRGSIVHEGYSEWDRAQYDEARRRLGEVNDIAFGFISRVVLQISKGSALPALSGKFKLSLDATHPGTALVVTTLKVLPNKDWKIKSNWL